MATLPELLSAEVQRCRLVAQNYTILGSTGAFGAALLNEALQQAERALQRHDITAMQRVIDRLRSVQDVVPPATNRPRPVSPAPALRALPGGRPLWVPPRPAAREQFFTWGRRRA